MSSTISLREYNLRYPGTAAVRTLSQNGGLAWLLEQRRHKAATRARQRAREQRWHEAVRRAFRRGWQMLKEGFFRHTPPSAVRVPHHI